MGVPAIATPAPNLPALTATFCRRFDRRYQDAFISGGERRIFDLGWRSGSVAAALTTDGYIVCGVDPSTEGIAHSHTAYPSLRLEVGVSLWRPRLAVRPFPVVIVEHVYAPHDYARALFDLVEPGGMVLVSPPYHSYLKNVALAVSGQLDAHFAALWDHGHLKFWSMRTLEMLLRAVGFSDVRFVRVGRVPVLARSMIAIAMRSCV